jgi:predicted DNA-binding protein YlxM (UPF0122 family)
MLDIGGGKMAGRFVIKDKLEVLAEAKSYYTRLVDIISDMQAGMPEVTACLNHNIPVATFREATLNRKRFLGEVKPLEAFELYKEPSWKLYEDVFCEKLSLKSLSKLPIDLEETILAILPEALSDTQQCAITKVYFERLSIEEAASQLHVTTSNVRSLVNRGLRNLRAPKYSKRIFYGDKFLANLKQSQFRHSVEMPEQLKDSDEYLDKSVEVLEISLRTYNCLRRAGVHTVRCAKDVIDKEQLWKLRNLGPKGVNETILAVNRYIAREEGKQL